MSRRRWRRAVAVLTLLLVSGVALMFSLRPTDETD
jgi:hypothetical protein